MWLREARTIEEREDDPPEDDRDTRLDERIAELAKQAEGQRLLPLEDRYTGSMKPEPFQLLAMAIGPVATLSVVFLGVLFQNRHVDVRISDLQRSMEVRFADLTRSTDARFSSVDGK